MKFAGFVAFFSVMSLLLLVAFWHDARRGNRGYAAFSAASGAMCLSALVFILVTGGSTL